MRGSNARIPSATLMHGSGSAAGDHEPVNLCAEPICAGLRAREVIFSNAEHPELVAKPEDQQAEERREPGKERDASRREDHEAWVVSDEGDRNDECEYHLEDALEDAGRIFGEVLKAEHDDHDVAGAGEPEAGRSGEVHQGDHEE